MNSSRPAPGSQIPNLQLTLLDGQHLELHSLRGQAIWLALFRFAACPFCARRVHQLSIEHDLYSSLGIKILAVFPSRPDIIRRYVAKFPVPFTIVCDPDELLYSTLGMRNSVLGSVRSALRPSHLAEGLRLTGLKLADHDGSKFRMPADFLIDRELRVHEAYYAKEADDGIPLANVLRFAQEQAQE